jgi:formate dehydrogenase major subunit
MAMQHMGDGESGGVRADADAARARVSPSPRRRTSRPRASQARLQSPALGRQPSWRQYVGFVPTPISRRSQQLQPRIRDAKVSISVCPFCAVGCSQQVFVKDGRIIDIEGNSESPINDGRLCPKGASTYQLIHNPDRPTAVLYRAPGGDRWEERPLAWAMERIAQLVKQTRDADFQMTDADGARVNRLESVAHVGGATLDNEENYLILKLFRNLGIVHITNQARI